MSNDSQTIKLACPICRKTVYWNEQYPYRPFCSERCKLIDLGEWANENHRIPGEDASAQNDEFGG